MALLFSKEILNAVEVELRNAKESVQIISAYCKLNAIKKLEKEISPFVSEKKIMLRFLLEDLIKGSTDFSVLEYCVNTGWKVYIRFDLHAKTYIIDGKRGFVGSANATNTGLNLVLHGNMEMGTLVDIDKVDMEKIEALYVDAILVNDEIYCKLKNQYQNIDNYECGKQYTWNDDIKKLFHPKVITLFSHELPEKIEFSEGEYIAFLDVIYNGDKDMLKNVFRWSNAYLWLLNILKENDGCLFFGAMTEKLHSALVSDPKPYRKDVKQLLSNLLELIEYFEMEEVAVDRPNYSQRIKLK